jgi:hypothetical protein
MHTWLDQALTGVGRRRGKHQQQRKQMTSMASTLGGQQFVVGLLLWEEGRMRCLRRWARRRLVYARSRAAARHKEQRKARVWRQLWTGRKSKREESRAVGWDEVASRRRLGEDKAAGRTWSGERKPGVGVVGFGQRRGRPHAWCGARHWPFSTWALGQFKLPVGRTM